MWTTLATLLEFIKSGVNSASFLPLPFADLSLPSLEVMLAEPLIEVDPLLIIDETASLEVAELDLGPLTDLGPGSLNLEAMAALDADIALLSDLEDEAPIRLPAPFACDLAAESLALSQSVAGAPKAAQQTWEAAVTHLAIASMPQQTPEQQCAYTRAMQEALNRAVEAEMKACSPISLALALSDTIARISPSEQPHWARQLSLLAQKQADYTYLGKDITALCPEYQDLEARMQAAIRG